MRVAILLRALTPGGAERQAVLVATGLHARGHRVTLIVFQRVGGALEAEVEAAGVELVELGKRSRWNLAGPFLRLRSHVRTRQVDVVYAFLPTANVLAALLWGGSRRPAVVAGFRSSTTRRAAHDWLGRLLAWLESRLQARFAAGIVNSAAGMAQRRREGWTDDRLALVRNGLPASAPGFDAAARDNLRARWKVRPGEQLIGFAGRLDPVKGIEVLLQALAVLRAGQRKVRLVIAGAGSPAYVAALERAASAAGLGDAVLWLGHQSSMQAVYSAVDVLCLPSHAEGCSNVLAEAQACGVPVVATRVGEAPDLVDDRECLARPGDVAELTRALVHVLDGPPRDRAALRSRILATLDAGSMISQTETVLARACGAQPGPVSVLFVTMVFPWPSEAFAGVEVRALRACGAAVRVRALRGRHASATALLEDWQLAGLDVTSTSPGSILRGLGFGLRHPLLLAEGLAWLLRHGWRSPGLLFRCLALAPRMLDVFRECRRRPPRVLYLFWGHYPAWLGHLVLRWLPDVHVAQALNAYDLLYRFPPAFALGRRAHSVWTITAANHAEFAAAGIEPARVRVAARSLDLAEMPAGQVEREPGHLVTVARLEANKGVDDVLRVLAVLRGEGRAVRLTVIGEGPDHGRLAALARDLGVAADVTFTGAIGHRAVYAHLASAGLFLLLSRSPAERLPNAAKEALASGCVCVLTRTPGIEELVAPLEHPLVVAPGDWRAAAEAALDVLDFPARYAGDRRLGHEHMKRHFDARDVARARLAVWAATVEAGVPA